MPERIRLRKYIVIYLENFMVGKIYILKSVHFPEIAMLGETGVFS